VDEVAEPPIVVVANWIVPPDPPREWPSRYTTATANSTAAPINRVRDGFIAAPLITAPAGTQKHATLIF
jgi:hypothetical protein